MNKDWWGSAVYKYIHPKYWRIFAQMRIIAPQFQCRDGMSCGHDKVFGDFCIWPIAQENIGNKWHFHRVYELKAVWFISADQQEHVIASTDLNNDHIIIRRCIHNTWTKLYEAEIVQLLRKIHLK